MKHPEAYCVPSSFITALILFSMMGMNIRSLKVSQLRFSTVSDPDNPQPTVDCMEYTEQVSKNRPGGWHQLNLENKTVVQYARQQEGESCHVHLLQLYISKLPASALERDIFLYKTTGSYSSIAY